MKNVLIFVLGAAAGSLVTWKLVEQKYKKIADEEIESVVEYFNNKNNEKNVKSEEITEHYIETNALDNTVTERKHYKTEPEQITIFKDMDELRDVIEENEYATEDDGYTVETEPLREYIPPYVIAPEEFGEFGDKTVSLMYYADGVLATDDDEIICDPEGLIGDALQHFGEYEDDCVHVRDESTDCDYEILKSEKTFSEVYKGDK